MISQRGSHSRLRVAKPRAGRHGGPKSNASALSYAFADKTDGLTTLPSGAPLALYGRFANTVPSPPHTCTCSFTQPPISLRWIPKRRRMPMAPGPGEIAAPTAFSSEEDSRILKTSCEMLLHRQVDGHAR
jgi:hypothetical protein